MNHHLNIFRFFNESSGTEFIENNLSRAFAICLKSNSLLLISYLKSVISDQDYEYLFSAFSSDTSLTVDIQVDTAQIERESVKKVYAVAMTSDRNLILDDFFGSVKRNKKSITDVFISIKDVVVIIEVKRTGEDCKQQLFNQIAPFLDDKEKYSVTPVKFSWQEAIKLFQTVMHVQDLVGDRSETIHHFLELSEIRYPEWFEPLPFNNISFSSISGSQQFVQLEKRMRQALVGISKIAGEDFQVLPYNDRLGITIPFTWATELIPGFEQYPDNFREYITFYIWPGNTKQQGYSIFNKPLNWIHRNALKVNGEEYELEVKFNVKMSHFMGKYVSQINFYEKDQILPLHTKENFYDWSGKWKREDWGQLESFFDTHFKPEFDWRAQCDWNKNFLDTDRSYVFISLGFEVALYIPYRVFRNLDKRNEDITSVSKFILDVSLALKALL